MTRYRRSRWIHILSVDDPTTVGVRWIKLTKPQQVRLDQLATFIDWTTDRIPGSFDPYDRLTDWGLIEQRQTTMRITPRGSAWLAYHRPRL